MQTAVLDTRIEAALGIETKRVQKLPALDTPSTGTALPAPPPPISRSARTTPREEIRRLPAAAKNAALGIRAPQGCCDGKCGMENPERVAGNIVRAAQEIINGARPINMLTRWVTSETFEAVKKRLSIQARSSRPTRRTVTITSSRVCRIDHDTIEGTVILSDGGRIRAAVVRLEAFRGRWRASYLQTL